MVNGICKTKFEKLYDPNTAPINDFENRFLVYILQKLSDSINEKVIFLTGPALHQRTRIDFIQKKNTIS
jgi:hypothetical protein